MVNLKSKVINLSAVARLLNVLPTTLYNRVYAVGRYKPLSEVEIEQINELIKKEILL